MICDSIMLTNKCFEWNSGSFRSLESRPSRDAKIVPALIEII